MSGLCEGPFYPWAISPTPIQHFWYTHLNWQSGQGALLYTSSSYFFSWLHFLESEKCLCIDSIEGGRQEWETMYWEVNGWYLLSVVSLLFWYIYLCMDLSKTLSRLNITFLSLVWVPFLHMSRKLKRVDEIWKCWGMGRNPTWKHMCSQGKCPEIGMMQEFNYWVELLGFFE